LLDLIASVGQGTSENRKNSARATTFQDLRLFNQFTRKDPREPNATNIYMYLFRHDLWSSLSK
jgi:hypothetical protein